MDAQIALQLLLTIAKISGTFLALFMAVIIFALKDDDLAQLILEGKPHGYTPLIVLLSACITLSVDIVASLIAVYRIDLGEPYNDFSMLGFFVVLCTSIAMILYAFTLLLLEKRGFLKRRSGR